MDNDFVFDTEDGRCEIDTYIYFREEWSAMETPYAVMDLEVTDHFEEQGEIMGMQALLISPVDGKASELDLLVKTEKPAPAWLLQELGLDAESIATRAVDGEAAIQTLTRFLGKHPVFVHGAAFDRPFIDQIASQCGLQFENQMFDTVDIAEMTWYGQRCSQYSLVKMLKIKPAQDNAVARDAREVWEILLAARKLAHGLHTKRIEEEIVARKLTKTAVGDSGLVLCPFCKIQHSFYP